MISYEVQIQQSGSWNTDSTYDDRELAELRARQVESGSRTAPVRVVEEVFEEKTQKYVLRTIYRNTESKKSAQAKVGERRPTPTQTATAARPRERNETEGTPEGTPEHPSTLPANRSKSLSAGQLGAIFMVIVGLGIGALIALEYFLKLS